MSWLLNGLRYLFILVSFSLSLSPFPSQFLSLTQTIKIHYLMTQNISIFSILFIMFFSHSLPSACINSHFSFAHSTQKSEEKKCFFSLLETEEANFFQDDFRNEYTLNLLTTGYKMMEIYRKSLRIHQLPDTIHKLKKKITIAQNQQTKQINWSRMQ